MVARGWARTTRDRIAVLSLHACSHVASRPAFLVAILSTVVRSAKLEARCVKVAAGPLTPIAFPIRKGRISACSSRPRSSRDVRLDVANVGRVQAGAIDGEDCRCRVHGGQLAGVSGEPLRPQTRAARELEDVPARTKRIERSDDCVDFAEPPRVRLGTAVVPSLPEKPFVVFSGSRAEDFAPPGFSRHATLSASCCCCS